MHPTWSSKEASLRVNLFAVRFVLRRGRDGQYLRSRASVAAARVSTIVLGLEMLATQCVLWSWVSSKMWAFNLCNCYFR